MTQYWDLSPKERGMLTIEELEKYADYELMVQGVVKNVPIVAVDLPKLPELQKETYYECCGILFDSPDKITEFLKLDPKQSEYDYSVGYDFKFTKPCSTEMSVRHYYTRNGVFAYKEELIKRNALKDKVEKDAVEVEKQAKKVKEALKDMYDDWNKCRSLIEKYKNILATYEQYLKMTSGNEEIAKKFLAKAFDSEDIKVALENKESF